MSTDSRTTCTVSVLIVNFHCAQLTCRAVASTLRDQPTAEVIVVDNSVDADESARLSKSLDARCRLLIAEHNLGFGAANEWALAHASAPLVMLLNPDAIIGPGCIERLASTLAERPDAGIVAPRSYWDEERQFCLPTGLMESPGREFGMELARRHTRVGRFLSRRNQLFALRTWTATAPIDLPMASGAALMLRRQDIDRIGGLFDPRFFMFYEDTDLAKRVHQHGLKLLLEPRAEIIHAWRMDAHKGPLMADGRRRYMAKYYPNNALLNRVDRLRSAPYQAVLPFPFVPLGALQAPPCLQVPPDLATGWLLEVSPSPLFVPSAGRLGQGESIGFDSKWWENLAPGQYFLRLSQPGKLASRYWSWSIPPQQATEDVLGKLEASWSADIGAHFDFGAEEASPSLLRRFGLIRNAPQHATACEKIAQPTWRTGWAGKNQMAAALALFSKAFGKSMDARLWLWKYREAPKSGIGVWRNEQLVAFYGCAPRHLLFFGEPLAAVQSCDVMTDPTERGMLSREGPFFAATQTFSECCLSAAQGYRLAFGFPSDRHFRLGQRLGLYFKLDQIVELAWYCRRESPSLSYKIRPWQHDAHYQQKAEYCWSEMAASFADYVLPVRDAAFLEHRYLKHPLFKYDCLLVQSRWSAKPLGIAVLRQHDDWVELIDLIGHRDSLTTLLAAARRFTAASGRQQLRGWITSGCAALLSTGDNQICETGITIPLAKNPALARISEQKWFLMAGDSDFH